MNLHDRIMSLWLKIIFPIIVPLCFQGCITVGPDYVKPEQTLPTSWHADSVDGLSFEKTDLDVLATWWDVLGDPILSDLIKRALLNNLDVKETQSKIREARARRGISHAELFPSVDASGSASSSKSNSQTREFYSAGFDAGWEIDLFGGNRRTLEAAEANLQASREQLHNISVSLAAEVALNYIEARTYQIRLSVAEANLKLQQETFELIRSRYEAGLSDELSLKQALYNLESTKAQIPSLRTGLEGARNRLSILIGEPPGAVNPEIEKPMPLPVPSLKIAVGLPADTLKQRPDVRRAEWALIAQTARVGAATADLYPKIRLSGSIGLEALTLDDFFSSENQVSSIGPRISWPVFHAGAIRQNIEVQSALQEQSLYQYKSVVLSALEEVENALIAFGNEQMRHESLLKAAESVKQTANLSRTKYFAGLSDFQVVIDAERSLLSIQDQLAQSQGTILSNLIRLYKALGGGWSSEGVKVKAKVEKTGPAEKY